MKNRVNGRRSKLALELRSVEKLTPNPSNARTHSDAQIDHLCRLIREYGWTKPVIVDERGMILAGHGAVLAARRMGMEAVPCRVITGLSAAQKRAYTLADNRIAEDSGWDQEMVEKELAALAAKGFDLGLTGFDSEGIHDATPLITEIATTDLQDRFWISVQGPLKSQAKTLQALRKATSGIEGVEVELGTIEER